MENVLDWKIMINNNTHKCKCKKCGKPLFRHISELTSTISHYACYACHTTFSSIEEDNELFTEEDYDKED